MDEQRFTQLEKAVKQLLSRKEPLTFGRIGRARHPGLVPREIVYSVVMKKGSGESTAFGNDQSEVSAEILISNKTPTFLWAVDFALKKPNSAPNVGLVEEFLPLSARDVPLYPYSTPVGQIDWRFTGKSFSWGIYENSGKIGFQGSQDALRPSSDCIRPYGYVLPEEWELTGGDKFVIKAQPEGGINAWTGEPQTFQLQAILRCYEMQPQP